MLETRINDLDGLWTETDVDIMTEGDFDPDIGEDSILDLDTEPLRYEDYLRQYLSGDSELSTPNADPATLQRAAPKTKEQIISELAPKIANPGITPARAMMEAQRLYTEAEKIFGADTDIVLEMLQPDQNPRKFLDGFQNAYIAGKMGDKAALENSSVAAYLTEEQRRSAYALGNLAGNVTTRETLDIMHNNSTMESDDLWVGKSLGAKAKNFKVMDLETGEFFYFAEGTRLQNVEVFAGAGSGKIYEKAYKYADKHGGLVENWQHVKGIGWLETPDGIRLAEVHWSQCAGKGKFDFFVKKWKDD